MTKACTEIPNRSIPPVVDTSGDVISPGEAKFWREWAQKSPDLLRKEFGSALDGDTIFSGRNIGFSLGVVLAGASFTKYIPGKWKILSGIGAAGSLLAGWAVSEVERVVKPAIKAQKAFIEELGKNPELQEELANYLAKNVTADAIRKDGLERAVINQAGGFGLTTPYFKQHAPSKYLDVANASGVSR